MATNYAAAFTNGLPVVFWWQSGTLFNAQRGGIDPSQVYTSTDLPDALQQVGYEHGNDQLVNDCPEDFENF